jgi:hypothetical protein
VPQCFGDTALENGLCFALRVQDSGTARRAANRDHVPQVHHETISMLRGFSFWEVGVVVADGDTYCSLSALSNQ